MFEVEKLSHINAKMKDLQSHKAKYRYFCHFVITKTCVNTKTQVAGRLLMAAHFSLYLYYFYPKRQLLVMVIFPNSTKKIFSAHPSMAGMARAMGATFTLA